MVSKNDREKLSVLTQNFLDKYYYPQLKDKGNVSSFRRVSYNEVVKTNKDEFQDVLLNSNNNSKLIVYERFSSKINRKMYNVSFIIFETDSIGRKIREYELTSKYRACDYILVTKLKTTQNTISLLKESDILGVSVILVSVKAITNYIAKSGFDYEYLNNKKNYFRDEYDRSKPLNLFYVEKDNKYMISISIPVLKNLSKQSLYVDRNRIIKI